MKYLNQSLWVLGALALCIPGMPVWAQSITPANDGTGTIVEQTGNQIDINGGTISGDGATLFHGFREFGLSAGEIANFNATPEIQNILGRVTGGNASYINGLIQVSGSNANLFLLNPAGILFGSDFNLNLSGSFTATTADGISFGTGLFEAVGSPDYAALVGNPTGLVFSGETPAALVNAGNITVAPGQTLRLVGGQVINTGTLSAPGGDITIAAVPGESFVRISQPGTVLGLELQTLGSVPTAPGNAVLTPLDLPALLTGSPVANASGVVVNADGTVSLTGSTVTIPNQPGVVIASGVVNAAGASTTLVGGRVDVLGETVGVLGAAVDVSGEAGGGQLRVGGDYLGQGPVPNADITVLDEASTINADATGNGDGGRVIVWSDTTSRIAGAITARGGVLGGDGGFVETSSAGFLDVDGAPDVSAFVGSGGTWLIDPRNIVIGDFSGVSTNIPNVNPFTASGDSAELDLQDLIAAMTGGSNVTVSTGGDGSPGFQAGDITLQDPLSFDGTGNASLTLNADNRIFINAPITDSTIATPDSLDLTLNGRRGVLVSAGASIETQGGDVNIQSDGFATTGAGISINAPINSSDGDIDINGTGTNLGLALNAVINAGTGDLRLEGNSNNGSGLVIGPSGDLVVANDPSHIANIELFSNSVNGTGIALNQSIDTRGRNLTLNGRRGVLVSAGASIETQGGDVNIQSDGFATTGAGISINAPINSSDGDIDINGTGTNLGLALNAVINAGTGDLRLEGNSNNGSGLVIGPSGDLVVANDPSHIANIELFSNSVNGTGIALNQSIDTRGRNLTLNGRRGVLVSAGASIETQGGDVNIQSDGFATTGAGISINAPINSSDGDIDINGTGTNLGLALNAVINAGTGDLRLEGNSNNGSGLVIGPSGDLVVANDPSHIANIELFSNSVNGTGIALNQSIDTRGRNLTLNGRRGVLVSAGASIETQGGDVNIQSDGFAGSGEGVVVGGFIDASGGNISVQSLARLATDAIDILGSLSTNDGALISLEADGNINAGDITNVGGDINILSRYGNITTGIIDSSNNDPTVNTGNAGNITLETTSSVAIPNPDGRITTGLLLANSDTPAVGNGGDIAVTANGAIADIVTGNITTQSGAAGDGGDIVINTPGSINTVGGILSSIGATNGGRIDLEAGSDIDTADIRILLTSGFILNSGNIALTSTGGSIDTSSGDLITEAGGGNAGDISLDAIVGSLILGTVNAQSVSANGGALTFNTGQDITLTTGSVSTNDNDIAFNYDVNLAGDAEVNSFGTGNIIFNTPVDGAFDLSLNPGSGEVILNEVVGGNTQLNDFAFSGILRATIPSGFDINTNQITLLGDASIISNSGVGVTIDSPLDGFYNLSLDAGNGTLQLDAPIGRAVPLNTLTALDPIITSNPSGVSITTVNGLTTQAITAAGGIGLLSPNGPITTGDLNTSAIGSAGDVVLGTNGLATVRTINAQSTNGVGGDVEIIANSFFRATSTFTGQSGQPASISVAGASDGGTVSIRHGGNGITEFIVGSPISNGTSGAISRGATAIQNIASIQGFLNTYAQDSDRLQIISVPGSLPSVSLPINSSSTNSNNSNGNPQVTLAQNIGRRINATTYIDDTRDDGYAFEWTLPGGDDLSLDVDIPVVNLGLNPEDSVALVDELLEEDIEEHFDEEFSNTEVTAQSIRQSLTEIEAETGTRAVVLYVVSLPDSLELLLVTPEGNVLHSSVEEDATTRDQVIQRFLRTVSIPTHDFLIDLQLDDAPARQLYAWMIEPFAAYLKELNIDTLIFAMDAGLRSLPVAALHDGEKFLVEQYSLGLVPSFSLTDTRYQSLADANVLAMGISDFTAFGLEPLPSVPNELEVIEALWPGLTALNSEATLANLQTLRYQQEAEVIHLASHAAFVPGDPQNSHIQLWDTQLDMDGLRNLRWGDFPEVELLVLSACQTALGNVEAELGFAGLAVNSGVKSALASLWNVNDFSTQVLMHELYDQLHQAPTKAEALQEAQLAFLRGQLSPRGLETFQRGVGVVGRPNEGDSTTLPTQLGDLSHPYYWASFTMIGSPW